MREQKYYRGSVLEFKTEEFKDVRCIGVVESVEEENDEWFYWFKMPNSGHRVSEKSILTRYVDAESGNY